MTDPTSLLSLGERVEKATGPDHELNALIWLAVTPGATRRDVVIPSTEKRRGWKIDETRDPSGRLIVVPSYTGSIDAAMALVPEDMRDEIEITTLYQVARVTINMNHGADGSPFYGSNVCNSIPLAICAAALKARASVV